MSDCAEQQRLWQAWKTVATEVVGLRKRLSERIGISTKAEFDALTTAIEERWAASVAARTALEAHEREHRCTAGDQAMANKPNQ